MSTPNLLVQTYLHKAEYNLAQSDTRAHNSDAKIKRKEEA